MTAEAKSAMHRIALGFAAMVGLLLVGPALAQDPERTIDLAVKGGGPGPASLFSLILKGGYVMIPLGLCSVLALAMAVERFISLKRDKILPPEFVSGIKGAFAGSGDIDKAVAYCEERPSPISNVFRAGISRVLHGAASVEKAIEDAGSREVDKLKRSLRPLSVIATVAPLLGLLGTVYGMISAFQSASAMGVGKADRLATGIYEALVTTAAGLTLAIPVLVVYQILCSRVDKLVDHMDDEAIEFLEYAAYSKAGADEADTAKTDNA
ncbi:MAG: MotA/TolQ/ExbB proton channel family protein [Phycisphaerae bacterium]|nr:MotA/TolQ/ExbB proton channel family protein [Phycisphaerae bacterium]